MGRCRSPLPATATHRSYSCAALPPARHAEISVVKHLLIAAQISAGRTHGDAILLGSVLHFLEPQGKPSLKGWGQASDTLCIGNKKRGKRHIRRQAAVQAAHTHTWCRLTMSASWRRFSSPSWIGP
jgi:hypothetical protein